MNSVGFTTTVPLEILIAAQKTPVDLNNIFITDPAQKDLLKKAEIDGFPRNICSWVKGIYAVVLQTGISEVIAVTQGDCSNTQALLETLAFKGITTIPFFYPYDRDKKLLTFSLEKLMNHYGVTHEQCLVAKTHLDRIRKKVHVIDALTWKEDIVSGFENHFYQVSTSDMNQDCHAFERDLDRFIATAHKRTPFREDIRLGYIGVPPIFNDLYPFIETLEARVVFNETQRQFSMPYPTTSLLDQYLSYTYPYDIFARIDDIHGEAQKRKLDGLIHYVQSFCFRQIEDTLFKKTLKLPILTIEGDQPAPLDSRNRMKIEVFVEMLRSKKNRSGSRQDGRND
jgi:benzoyl-CoA reductase/2-hydroxyglutaryl-CoA dehydratase subunit BcrC/BadD/HgdB